MAVGRKRTKPDAQGTPADLRLNKPGKPDGAWNGYILTHYDYANAFFSHHEYIDFYSDDSSRIDTIKDALSLKTTP